VCGSQYTPAQRERIGAEVAALRGTGLTVTQALRGLGVVRSTYYHWQDGDGRRRRGVHALLPEERTAIVQAKQRSPYLRHRTISGVLRAEGIWVSPSSCYRVLAAADLVEPYERREAPWRQPRYEPRGPNLLWGEDWTGLVIDGQRWYLLVLLDSFSRLIVSWSVVRTVKQRDVRELVAQGMLAQGLDRSAGGGPRLRTDRGSPNVAGSVKEFFDAIGIDLSLGRVRRPTDNARVERCNGTLKQEEMYCQGSWGYLSPAGARRSLGRYIAYYNRQRPHQALWGFTPAQVHRGGNKTELLEEYRRNVAQAKQNRLRQNRLRNGVKLATFSEISV
jgi:putative transposase